jgi:hypothetical protein
MALLKEHMCLFIITMMCLFKTIYIESLALHAPIAEETRNFEQEQRNRELEEELEAAFNFLRRTTISIITLTPQVVISNLKEEVEIL